jgi:hypothetical protein
MRRHEHLAIRQRKIHLSDQLNDFVDRFVVTNVDQNPFWPIVNKIHVAAHPLAGLNVHFNDMGENWLANEHE